MKTLALIVLLASPAFAGGPRYQHGDAKLNDEVSNIYRDLKYPNIVAGRANQMDISSGTIKAFTVVGTTWASTAESGRLGEYKSATATNVSAVTTGVYQDMASITLTPGDWDVYGNFEWISNGATWSQCIGVLSRFSGDDQTDHVDGDNLAAFSFGSTSSVLTLISLGIQAWRVSVSQDTTVYLKGRATWTANGPPRFYGRISARRVR